MLKCVVTLNPSTNNSSGAGSSQHRPVNEPKTPSPRRRMRHLRVGRQEIDAFTRATQLRQPRLEENEAETVTDAEYGGVEILGNGAYRVGRRPRVVHFDVPGDDDVDETTYEYYPPGVPVPPSRRELFLSRPRRRRWLSPPPPPSQEVQIAMAQIRAEIQAQENPPPRTKLGRVIEHYVMERECRRMYGKTEVRVEGYSYRARRRLRPVCRALRRFLCCVRQH